MPAVPAVGVAELMTTLPRDGTIIFCDDHLSHTVPYVHMSRQELALVIPADIHGNILVTDSRDSPILMPSAPVHDARTALHSYFSKFAGCRGCVAEVVPAAPADADLLDLRRSLPEEAHPFQYLDLSTLHVLEAEHVRTAGISSGDSDNVDSDYDSHSSFIDDSPTDLTAADAAYVDAFVASKMPLTAEKLREQPASPATVAASKRRRIIITSSSSSP